MGLGFPMDGAYFSALHLLVGQAHVPHIYNEVKGEQACPAVLPRSVLQPSPLWPVTGN